MTKETVILIHGTFAALKAGKEHWYELQSPTAAMPNFATKLNAELEKRNSKARCWAHCSGGHEIFHWSGRNSWTDRAEAAKALATHVNNLRNEGWRCHILAHSHGGNVAIDALPQLNSNNAIASIVTMGTPFLSEYNYIKHSQEQRIALGNATAGLFAWLFVSPGALLAVTGLFPAVRDSFIDMFHDIISLKAPFDIINIALYVAWNLWWSFIICVCASIILFTPIFIAKEFLSKNTKFDWSSIDKQCGPYILIINSKFDEAWQFLHHFNAAANPFIVNSSLFTYVIQQRRDFMRRSFLISNLFHIGAFSRQPSKIRMAVVAVNTLIFGFFIVTAIILNNIDMPNNVQLFIFCTVILLFIAGMGLLGVEAEGYSFEERFSALWSPWRLFLNSILCLVEIPNDCIVFVVRRKIWPLLQELSFGQTGFRSRDRVVERVPSCIPKNVIRYEDLQSNIETAAISNRGYWLGAKNRDIAGTFAKSSVTNIDIFEMLVDIETDMTLVHAAYYMDDNSIERIANWIVNLAGQQVV